MKPAHIIINGVVIVVAVLLLVNAWLSRGRHHAADGSYFMAVLETASPLLVGYALYNYGKWKTERGKENGHASNHDASRDRHRPLRSDRWPGI